MKFITYISINRGKMQRITCFFILVNILICTMSVSSNSITLENIDTQSCFNDDILDQAQIVGDEILPVGNFQLPLPGGRSVNWTITQSFTPGLVILTRVKLLFAHSIIPTTTYPLIMTIRKTLTGENLVKVAIEPEDVQAKYLWVEFDFEDIPIDAGEEYYIVCYTANISNNTYLWAANPYDPYPAGHMYYSIDDGATWDDLSPDNFDMCFMTYGRNNTKPDSPIIDGPPQGSINKVYGYEFSAHDPDGDDMTYYVEWGDGGTDTGFVPSDGAASLSHIWTTKGEYEIRAKLIDKFGYESDWTILETSIPKKPFIPIHWFLSWLIQQFSLLKILTNI